MIKKQHAIVLAVIGALLVGVFVFFPRTKDLTKKPLQSPTNSSKKDGSIVKYKLSKILTERQGIPGPTLVDKNQMKKVGNSYIYTFNKATQHSPSYKNFQVSLPEYWNAYELGPSNDLGSYPVAGKYHIILVNLLSGEHVTISQFANMILSCDINIEGNALVTCKEEDMKKISTNFGNSYLLYQGIISMCVEIKNNKNNIIKGEHESVYRGDCTPGTSVGLINIHANNTDYAETLPQDILDILGSIKAVD